MEKRVKPKQLRAPSLRLFSGVRVGNVGNPEAHPMYSRRGNALASTIMPPVDANPMLSPEPALHDLFKQASEAALHSYSPYSRFRVGAALKLTNGAVVTGTNVENVSYGLPICAERSALVSAVSQF